MIRRAKLNVAVAKISELAGFHRLDAEYYQQQHIENEAKISRHLATLQLGEIATTFAKGIFDINAEEYISTGVPFIRITNLRNGIIAENDLAFIPLARHQREAKTALQKYDIVLSKTAYPAASLVQLDSCNVSQDTIAIKTNRSKDFNAYLVVYLNTRFGLLQMKRLFQGNVQMHLALAGAKKIAIPIPD